MNPLDQSGDPGPAWKRLLWLIVIWAGSVALLGIVAMLIRAVLKP